MNQNICKAEDNKYFELINSLQENKDFRLCERIDLSIENDNNNSDAVQAVSWEVGNTKYSRKNVEALLYQFYNEQGQM